MFYVIDLSWPRKFIQKKIDDIMLDLKLNPPRVNKTVLVSAAVIGIILIAGTTAFASGPIDSEQYNTLLQHYVRDLHFPKDYAEKAINNLSSTDLKELYSRVDHHNQTAETYNKIIEAGNFISRKTAKTIETMKSLGR